MWDVYLGGVSDKKWRETFKKNISSEIKIFDPYLKSYNKLNNHAKHNQFSKELCIQEDCAIAVFYLNPSWDGTSTLLELGMSIGNGKQVMVCLDGKVKGSEQIEQYCNFYGVPVCKNLEELVLLVEEFINELEMLDEK